MAVLKSCFCYSLRQGSFIIGSYALIVYCVAFAVELWWIVESLLILPAPAYTLCALYFFNFIMAAVLLFGLLVRQRRYLMSWTLMTVLSFFPEAGMVLFMSLYYWPGQKYEYGVIELVYWSIRAMFNIFGAVCVCSLYLTWRDEELILGRLHDLTLANVEAESQSLGSVFIGGGPGGLSVLGRQQQHHPHQVGGGNGTLLRGGGHLIGDNLSIAALNKANNNGGIGTLKSKSTAKGTTPAFHVNVSLDVDVDVDVKFDSFISGDGKYHGGGDNDSDSKVVSTMEVNLELDTTLVDLDLDAYFPPAAHNQCYTSACSLSTSAKGFGLFGGVGLLRRIARWFRYRLLVCFPGRRKSSKHSLSLVSVSDFGGCGELGTFNTESDIRNGYISGSRSHLNTISSQNNQNTSLRASLLRMKSEFNPASLFDPASRKHRISELGIAGIGLEPPGQIPLHANGQRSRSLWNVSNEEYWSRPPPSRPVSMGYVNYGHQLDQLNNFNLNYNHHQRHQPNDFDMYHLQQHPHPQNNQLNMRSQSHTHLSGGTLRSNLNPLVHLNNNPNTKNNNQNGSSLLLSRSGGVGGWDELRFQQGRRAQSMDALNMNMNAVNNNASLFQQRYYGQNILANAYNHTQHHHSSMLQRQWSQSSLEDDEQDDDGIRSYQDIPL